jgi:hypothetical protein
MKRRQIMPLNDRDAPDWDADGNRLWFHIDRYGLSIPCCIDALCLYIAFGAHTLREIDATHAYASRRGWVHSAALGKAGRGGFEHRLERPQVFVHLTARDL